MPIVKKIREMEKQGIDESAIVQQLQEEGFSPQQINEGLEQSKVKAAVSQDIEAMPAPTPIQQTQTQQSPQSAQPKAMTPSIVQPQAKQPSTQPIQATQPPTQPIQPEPLSPASTAPTQNIAAYPEQYAYPEEQYPEQQYPEPTEPYPAQYSEYPEQYAYPEYQASDTETISEIAEQIADEKLGKLRRQISEMIKFKTETEGKTSNIDYRLRKIETIIDRLQASILKKIGEYGQNIEDLKKETIATQGSFSKILDPMSENIRKLKKISKPSKKATKKEASKKKTKKQKAKTSKTRKRRDHFEKYLR